MNIPRVPFALAAMLLSACGHAAAVQAASSSSSSAAASEATLEMVSHVLPPSDEDTFVDQEIGVALRKPKGWTFVSSYHVKENRREIRTNSSEMDQALQERARLPLVAATKYPEARDDVNPTIQVVVRPRGTMARSSATALAALVTSGLSNSFRGFSLETPPTVTTVSGHEAAHVRARYELGTLDGRTYQVLARLWIVPRGEYCYLIGMSGPAQGADRSDAEFQAVLRSVVIP
jgi:hypothetical protein